MTEEEQRREMSEQITKSSRNVSAVGNSSRGSNNFPDRASEAFALAAKQAQQHYQSGNKGGTGGGNAIQTPNKPATEHEIIFEKDSQISEVTGTSTTRSYPLPKTSSAVPSEFSATFSIAEDPKEAEEKGEDKDEDTTKQQESKEASDEQKEQQQQPDEFSA